MKSILPALLLLGFLAIVIPAGSQSTINSTDPGDAVLGIWNTTDNKSKVQIFRGDHHYFGRVMDITEPNWPANDPGGMGGKPRTDRKNPNPALRQRPLLGLRLMENFTYAGRNKWEGGRIYDPESGKTYKCRMTLLDTNRLEVHGYVGISVLGRTVTWTRVNP
jgi:uncharacterized protein (DUF2147 family)